MSDAGKAGFVGAAATVALMFLWFQFAHWVIPGSAYTDLPGQDTHRLVNYVEDYALGVIALVAGRLAGLWCRSRRWLAALLAVSPVVLSLWRRPREVSRSGTRSVPRSRSSGVQPRTGSGGGRRR